MRTRQQTDIWPYQTVKSLSSALAQLRAPPQTRPLLAGCLHMRNMMIGPRAAAAATLRMTKVLVLQHSLLAITRLQPHRLFGLLSRLSLLLLRLAD